MCSCGSKLCNVYRAYTKEDITQECIRPSILEIVSEDLGDFLHDLWPTLCFKQCRDDCGLVHFKYKEDLEML